MRKRLVVLVCLLPLLEPSAASADTVRLPRTGQNACYDAGGVLVPCAGTGQDGEMRTGVAWPSPRFTDNKDGTVSDRMTGLIWLKNANCTDTAGGIDRASGLLDWPSALAWSNHLGDGTCGLSDSSAPGDWRLPNIVELRSLVDHSRHDPALPGGHPFSNVLSVWYWSSTSNPVFGAGAYNVGMSRGSIHATVKVPSPFGASRVGNKSGAFLGVWPVRGGR